MTKAVCEALINSNAVIEFDISGNIIWANEKYLHLMNYTLEEIQGKHHSIFLPDLHQNDFEYQHLWAQLSTGACQSGEFKRITRDKRTVWVQGTYTPVRDIFGNVLKVVKTAIDLTEQKRLAEHLEKKNQELLAAASKAKAATYAKSVFLANMSHEIRTPLNCIIGVTDTLAETTLDPQQASFVEILQRANHQLMTIINDVLDLSKVEAGEIEIKPLPFHLQKVLDDLYAVLGFRAKEKGLDLQFNVDPDVDECYLGDSDRLRQILMNLLNNAIKFTHQGSVSLNVSKNRSDRSGNLMFCIADTGIGIPRHKYKDIFRPFTQADPTTTRRYGGTGLGLSITQKMVNLMQGEIWLESEPNVGSIFYFTTNMPVTSEKVVSIHNPLQGKFQVRDSAPNYVSTRLRILVVDDVDDNRNLFGIYLQKTNHDISFASSGIEALEMIEEEHFDLVFMDVQMPEMDGYEATRRIRQIEKSCERPTTRIIACTANAFSEDITKSHQAGCDLHLSKPIRKDTLLKTIGFYFRNPEVVC